MQHILMIDENKINQILHTNPSLVKESTKEALKFHFDKININQPKKLVLRRAPDAHRYDRIFVLPVYLTGPSGVAGVKWIGRHPNNHNKGLKRTASITILSDIETNSPIAILDSALLTSLRTFAIGLIGIDIVHPAPKIVACLGMGELGYICATELPKLYPSIEKIQCFSNLKYDEILSNKIVACSSYQAALENADLVIAATSQEKPYIQPNNFSSNLKLIINFSVFDFTKEVYSMSRKNIIDDWTHCVEALTPFGFAYKEGLIKQENIIELSHLLFDSNVPKEFDGITMLNPQGMGVEDVILAYNIYKKLIKQPEQSFFSIK